VWIGNRVRITIGRASDNDIVLGDLQVSRRHARLERVGGAWRLTDLGSRNPTLVNGVPVAGRSPIADGDRITVGATDLRVDGDNLVATGGERTRLVADDVGFAVGGRSLLSGVSLDLRPGQLVAVVGPSGAGKSTLLKVLSGEVAPTSGRITYDGYDMHRQRSAVARRVGVVPQDDVVHTRLTARGALSYAAKLRLPDDTGAAARRRRVAETLAEVELTEHARKPIHRLSGGQRKRVSIALELLTAPSLLMLDEPTSGLDPALDKQIMGRLRELADAGRTVVVVTHNVTHLDGCDLVLLLAPGGVPVFSGRPAELRARFGTSDWADIFHRVVAGTAPPHQPAPVGPAPPPEAATEPPPVHAGLWHQVGTLAARHLRLILADPGYALFLLLVPVVLAVLALAVPGHEGLRRSVPEHPTEAAQMLVLVFVGAAFMGAAASAREAVAERAIFLRERAVGLRPGAYALAKALVFTLVAAVQSAVLVGVVTTVKPGPVDAVLLSRPVAELGVAVWLTALASCLLSLLGSALVRSLEQTTPVLVVTVMAQLVLCGGMIPVAGRPVLAQLSWLAPARWGYAAGASTLDLPQVGPPDRLWTHDWPWWLASAGALVLSAAACTALFAIRTRRLRPER
jgi:ABC-type multidrug transport system ATPase subunit